MFIRFGDAEGGRRLLKWLYPRTATALEVRRFNDLYSEGSVGLISTNSNGYRRSGSGSPFGRLVIELVIATRAN